MKVEIEEGSNGFTVIYTENNGEKIKPYVYRSIDDMYMMEEVMKRFLKRRVRIEEK